MEKVIIKLENIKKSYGDKNIIKNLNLEIYEGEIITFLGPSGCGKTTILRMISGLEDATSGKIYLDGKDMTGVEAKDREINTIFQSYALFPHMNVYDNIAFGLKMKKVPKEEIAKRVKAMLELVKLTGYEKRKPSELSGGEQQRVATARALINNPKVLLLDEPLSALEKKKKKQMRIELKELQQKLGITFIYVTHDQSEALSLSNRIMLMHNGKIVELTTPKDLYEHPKTKFAADFIGDANIFSGKVLNIKETFAEVLINADFKIIINNDNFKENDKVTIVIRPENIKLVTKDKDYNTYNIKIKSSIYDGAYYTVIAKMETNKELKILLPKDKYELLKDKDMLKVHFSFEDMVIIKGER